jgi:MFS family permease
MTQKVFMSYSRREVGFVDDLVRNLEERKYEVWLDYRNLIPGTPWQDQIYKGIHDSDVILLVVSKASLGSQNVEVEWRRVLEQNKRIILLIFEAVDLPPELEQYEWVDFRGSYKAGLDELFSQLEKPVQEEHPVPQTGFKVPMIVWVAALFGVLTAVISLFAFWTLFIPWLLALLPYRIIKRNFNFSQVQASLIVLPFALFMSAMTVPEEQMDSVLTMFACSIPVILIMVLLLRSAGMQRWGKEQATMPKFANPLKPNIPNPRPISFYVDYASEDRKIADELVRVLKKYGHVQKDTPEEARSVFVLLSRFKSDTEADPENQVVFPVVVQTGDVSKKLSKIQWIDMRHSVHGLNTIAQLLPEPEKLLKALGNRPRGNQLILPAPVTAMYYFLILLGVLVLGTFTKLVFGLAASDISMDAFDNALASVFFPYLISVVLTGLLIYFMTRSLLRRQGRMAGFWSFSLALFLLGCLLFWQFILGGNVITVIDELDPNADISAAFVTFFPITIYVIGAAVMGIFLFFRRRDIMLWFPAEVKRK